MTDLMALHDALDAAARAITAIEAGDTPSSSLLLWQAQDAASEAFLPGSPEAEGITRILAVIGAESLGAAA